MSNTIDRRSFLKGSALGAASIVAAAAVPAAALAEEEAGAEAAVVSPHAWENPPAPIDPAEIVETIDCEVLVIGAGTAGVCAAQSAAEAGAATVLIEQAAEFSARGHDVAAVGTKLQKEAGVEIDVDLMRDYYTQITCNKTDINLFNIWASKSGEVMDYYIDRLVADGLPVNGGSLGEAAAMSENPLTREFATSIQFGEAQMTEDGEYTNHLMVRYIEGYAREAGADIRYNTKAEQLIREGDGPVTGAIASTENGYIQINASKGVILATGGITQNPDMLKMWAPPTAKTTQVLYSPARGNMGDGLCMGMWVGAAHQKTNQATMALPSSAAAGGQNASDGRGIAWMTVNLKGLRYVKETSPGPNMCHATLPQPESQGWSIYDGNWEDYILQMKPDGKDFRGIDLVGEERNAAIEHDIEAGLIYRADSLEELAEQMGMPVDDFIAQVDRWNAACEKGADDEYSLNPSFLFPINTPPFYASRNRCGVLVCIYGLNVNARSQVCDEEDNPIEGLYAIGNVQGNFFTDHYPILIPGISHGRCVTFGRLLGQALAKGEQIA